MINRNADNIHISLGNAKDIPLIMPIMNMAFDPSFGEAWNSAQCLSMISLPYSQLFLAEYDNQICGFAFTRSLFEDLELLMIATHPDNARMGVASALMNYIIEIATSENRSRIFLEMRRGNSAEKFYNHYGFSEISVRKNYYRGVSGKYYDALTQERKI